MGVSITQSEISGFASGPAMGDHGIIPTGAFPAIVGK